MWGRRASANTTPMSRKSGETVLRNENILKLEIAVDDSKRMEVLERQQDLR